MKSKYMFGRDMVVMEQLVFDVKSLSHVEDLMEEMVEEDGVALLPRDQGVPWPECE